MLRLYNGIWPKLGGGAYVDVSAQVIGDVELGEGASVFMGAVVRGDINSIRIGRATNVQDNAVIHVVGGTHPTVVGDEVTVGHGAILHGCRVESRCLIGMGATVLDGALIGEGSIVAAGSLVPKDMVVPPRSLVLGFPATVRRELRDDEVESIRASATRYLSVKDAYLAQAATA